MKPCRALLLDLDQTLLDGSTLGTAVLRTCHDIAMRWPDLDEARLFEANGIVWREYWRHVEDAWTLGHLDGRAVGIEAWRRTLERCGYDDHTVATWAQERHWQHRADTLRLFDDVPATLEALAGRVPLALVTNGASDTQRHALGTLGIEGVFATVFISGERGIAKPAPEVFARVLGELGVAADHAWHVGDNLHTDVAGARAAGLTAVWLNRLGRPLDEDARAPNHEIRSLADLLTLSPELSSLP
jgi:putative hydrolase of the HAD superfamily